MSLFIIYAGIGIVIGFLSGIFGIGGSLITTPILKTFFSLPDLIALATPLPVVIPTAVAGAVGYMKKGVINKNIAIASIIGGLPATIIGSFATKFIASKWLMVLTGIFLIFVAIKMLYGKRLKETTLTKNVPVSVFAGIIGFVAGIFSGLLAVGGGIILIPAYVLLLGLTMQEAASTSLVCIAFFAIPGTIVHSYLGHIDWHIVLNLSVGVIPASYIGSKIALIAKSQQLQFLFSMFLMIFGIYFIFHTCRYL